MKLKTKGLVLSGGGARAIAHLGVLQAFEEEGIKFNKLAGTSAGAIIAVLFAAGMNPKKILDLLIKVRLWSFFSPVIPKKGLLGMSNVEKLLRDNLPVKTFEDLNIPVCVTATDVNKGVSVCFSSGDLIKPLMASCCIPVLFNPVLHEGRLYVDGGILNNLPVDLVRGDVDLVVGVHTNPIDPDFLPLGVKSMAERTFMMAIACNVYARRHLSDIFIEPTDLKTYKILDFTKSEEIYEIGYRYTKDNMHTFDWERTKKKTNEISGSSSSGNTSSAAKGETV